MKDLLNYAGIARGLAALVARGAILAVLAGARPVWGLTESAPPRFNRDIRPILADHCLSCHGPDAGKRKARLRLDVEDEAKAKVIVPGKPDASALLQRVFAPTEKGRMPPPNSGRSLTDTQKELLRQWIAAGAPWEPHWAYAPVSRPSPPEVAGGAWPRNAIDPFILARLEREKLRPSDEADRRTLMRRLSFDLTGLPPAPAEVDAFLYNNRGDAWERQVDRLLASPHFGERLAVWWLDLARYADSVGYHGDQRLTAWPYRDYVIEAFNRNLPFDQFTREQLAGDLLPGSTRAQKIASGFNRLGMMSAEGGVQDREYLAKYAAERVRTLSGAWLGATIGCAECHDHKFDPYTTRDFYRLEACFADLKEQGFYHEGFGKGDWGPSLRLPSAAQQQQLDRLDAELAAVRKTAEAVSDAALAPAREQWELRTLAYEAWGKLAWQNPRPIAARSVHGAVLEIRDDQSVFVTGPNPDTEIYLAQIPATNDLITALRLEVLKDEKNPGNDLARSGDSFYLSEVAIELTRGTNASRPVKVDNVTADFAAEGFPALALIDGKPETAWAQGDGPPDDRYAVFHFAEPLHGGTNLSLEVRLRHETKFARQTIGRFRLGLTALEWPPSGKTGVPEAVMKALKTAPEQRDDNQRQAIARHYRTVAPELEGPRRYVAQLEAERSLLLVNIPTALVAQAGPPRTVRVLARGNWMDDSGEVMAPGMPRFLNAPDAGTNRATRLDLANWLVARDNPLTARVLANRLWKLFFGTGLSKTTDDFGARGEPPVHPELLDWLAADLMDHGWDLKRTVRLMVTSATYRQSSLSSPELEERDPYNRLCARQSRVRLDAEFIRDNALAASGLLVDTLGGPSVKPWQPPGYWSPLNFPRREYEPDRGEATYRRGLYTHWQRTFPHPALLVFDAPSREECTVARTVSNTPLQALVLLNDPEFVEAARVLAERILRQPADFERRLAFAFARVLGRAPRAEETDTLRKLFHEQRESYDQDPESALSLVSVGGAPTAGSLDVADLAAWTSVSRSLLNLHETITRN